MNGPAGTPITAAQAAFQAADPAIALLDTEGTVVGWTQGAQRLVGYSPAEVVGRSAAVLLSAVEDWAKASAFREQNGAQSHWVGVAELRHRDGRKIDVRLCVSSLAGRDGRAQWVVSATDKATLSAWEMDGSVVESLHTALHRRLPIGVVIRDAQLRCLWANDTQGFKDGIPLQQRLGRRLTEAASSVDAETLEALSHQVLESGIPAINVEYRTFLPTNVHGERMMAASLIRLDDAEGRALGVCVVSFDVTDSRRARERLAILGEASKRIGTTLDAMRTAQELAELAVPLFADYATVDLTESVPLGEEPVAHLGPQGGGIPAFRRAGLASIRQGAPESVFRRGEPVARECPFARVLRSGKSLFEPILDTSPGSRLGQDDPAQAQKFRDHAMHSLMVVPIHARGAVLGMAVFVRTQDRTPFEQEDLLLAEELVSWAALSLDNARRYARERAAALTLQRHLLPQRATGGCAADVAWRYLPADNHYGVGGDWFDVIPLSAARVALVVGDVVGHGINAAAAMGRLRTAVRTLADMDMPPEELLAHLDDLVIRHLAEVDAGPQSPSPSMAGTCLYAVYDPVARCCTISGAGHPPPAIIDPHGGVIFPDLPTGAPLGLGMVPFESVTLELPEGSVLALYTDGLIEDRDHDIDVGIDRLGTALARPGLPLEDLCSSAIDTLPTRAPNDDRTLLLARTRALGPSQVASWELPDDPAVVTRARALATHQLNQWGLKHLAESTQLIVSELVTNAIRHSTGAIGLRLIRHEMLTCEVSDTSDSHPRLRHPRTTDENGRGLLLVSQVSHRWGTRCTPDGKLIWAEQQLTPSP
ncbi:SpoIIE family protein phosphatase [Streptomyces gibsoniae]|uniref:SpoIIE family protein phosphatase n=1 Tax=Streptomyces gibsoniae TaxID=3075529 RepID=A0ABU2U5E2_9ACTN|nr:SpoIIE family protein phosphatase [Streptomyces sp. DSM 41699]MDT0468431.1 SpoIIE family protein phosphatase [Streptomyces sp. DSM 41699]